MSVFSFLIHQAPPISAFTFCCCSRCCRICPNLLFALSIMELASSISVIFFDDVALVRRIWPSFKSFSVTIIDWSTLVSSSASCASFFSRFLFLSAFSSCYFILIFSSSASLSFLSFNSFSRFSFSFRMFIRLCAVVTAARMAGVIDVMWAPPIDWANSLPLL